LALQASSFIRLNDLRQCIDYQSLMAKSTQIQKLSGSVPESIAALFRCDVLADNYQVDIS
jgi:hypothetical protein